MVGARELVEPLLARLGLATANVQLAAATNIRDIVAALDRTDRPDVALLK